MAFVYILYSKTLDRYYIGSTDSTVEDRLRKHLTDHSGFTAKAKDWVVVYSEYQNDKKASMRRERQIKSWKSRVKIKELITNPFR
jgi:putative endonuclease